MYSKGPGDRKASIEVRSATVAYRDNTVLRAIDLDIDSGEMMAIIGPNGAGKTTLLTLINGLGRLIEGSVTVLGHKLTSDSMMKDSAGKLRRKIGYVPQSIAFDAGIPVKTEELVMMGIVGRKRIPFPVRSSEKYEVKKLLKAVGLSEFADRPIGTLSGGEFQRALIARAIAQNPKVLLLDEPTTGLDRKARTEILMMVAEIHKEKGLTTLMVTHDLNIVCSVCDRALLLKNGVIFADGKPSEVLSDGILNNLYEDEGFMPFHQHPHGKIDYVAEKESCQ